MDGLETILFSMRKRQEPHLLAGIPESVYKKSGDPSGASTLEAEL
jgi:hypothetical protein